MFALEREDLCPNMLCLGKGLGGGISIGALITEEDAIASLSPGELSGGSGGNALACASAMAVIDILEKEHLAEHAREVGNYQRRQPPHQAYQRQQHIQPHPLMLGRTRFQGDLRLA